jgi:predicted metal-dependent hydrolase
MPVSDQRFSVRRSDRARRARLTVTDAAEVLVVLPRGAPLAEAERLVRRHDTWIARHVGRLQAEQVRLAARPALGEGRLLEVDGRALCVRVEELPERPRRGGVRRAGGDLLVRPGQDGRGVTELLERWLRAEARRVIAARVAARAADLGVHPTGLSIRDQSTRWASATASGRLSFSWRLILVPPEVLDAVVVHELAHLRVRGHSAAFWTLVQRYAPQTPRARRWLRDHAREVRAALA